MAPTPDSQENAPKEMSFGDHLHELRSRLLKCAAAALIGTVGCYAFWEKILALFTGFPLSRIEEPPSLIYTAPAEAFMVSFKIAIFGGIVAAAPVILYQVWCFISPGLYLKEKRTIFPVVFFSTFFFLAGVLFSYLLVLPLAFRFLLGFNTVQLMPMLTINTYIGFVIKMLVAFGIVFEMPVFTFILARMGLITHRFLLKHFRYAVVVIFIIAALLTPPDILSQTLMAVPMLFLYGVSILVAFFSRRKDA